MATHKPGKGSRGGDFRKRDGWSGSRDHKSGTLSPGPRRSNSPWRNNYRSDFHKEHRDSQRAYAQHLLDEWRKVEQDLQKESTKDRTMTHTVEYTEKNLTEIKDEELFNVVRYLKNREEKPTTTV